MEYRELPNGLVVSLITFGCWEMGGGQWETRGDEVNRHVIDQALDWGVTTFDTAEGYGHGHSETLLGEALAPIRDRTVIATKVSKSHLRSREIHMALDNSLRRLRTDYIDIYYVHWPNPDVPLEETMSTLETLRQAGKIRAIGVSNFSLRQLIEARQYASVTVVQSEYSLLTRDIEHGLLTYCRDRGIAVFTYSSLAKGILSGVFHQTDGIKLPTDFRRERRLFLPEHLEAAAPLIDRLREIGERRQGTAGQIALRWLLDQPGISSVIIGSQNADHVRENLDALDLVLTEDDRRTLDGASQDVLRQIDG